MFGRETSKFLKIFMVEKWWYLKRANRPQDVCSCFWRCFFWGLHQLCTEENCKEKWEEIWNWNCMHTKRKLLCWWPVKICQLRGWCDQTNQECKIKADTLGFKIAIKEKPLTRRGMLSTLSSIYDPLGLGAPFLLKGKQIIQTLWAQRFSWDDQVPQDMGNDWKK